MSNVPKSVINTYSSHLCAQQYAALKSFLWPLPATIWNTKQPTNKASSSTVHFCTSHMLVSNLTGYTFLLWGPQTPTAYGFHSASLCRNVYKQKCRNAFFIINPKKQKQYKNLSVMLVWCPLNMNNSAISPGAASSFKMQIVTSCCHLNQTGALIFFITMCVCLRVCVGVCRCMCVCQTNSWQFCCETLS